ncbi:MAG: copper resistance protein NlpE N-terminal domain-containing protein [Flavobacteriales bacterium]
MRTLPSLLFATVLFSCGGNDIPTSEQEVPHLDTVVAAASDQAKPGYYEGTLPCADCEGIHTQLWLRSDSTFVRRTRYLGRDSSAFGTIGRWNIAKGLLRIEEPGDKADHFHYEAPGLRMVDAAGKPFGSALSYTLEKLADEINDEIPRMKVTGTFTYMADAMSFKPCGSTFSWPCAGGEQWTDEGEVLGSMNTVELERNYLKAVKQGGDPWIIEVECSLAMGPAMEGDGADEYIFIHRVLGTAQCP